MRKIPVVLVMVLVMTAFAGQITTTSADFSVEASITDAFYADLDSDGYEDDIAVDLSITLSNYQIYTDIDLYVGVELPSGQEFWFLFEYTVEKYVYSFTFYVDAELLNTALETGWYWAHAAGFADGEEYSTMNSVLFDPPGEQEGGDPVGRATVYY